MAKKTVKTDEKLHVADDVRRGFVDGRKTGCDFIPYQAAAACGVCFGIVEAMVNTVAGPARRLTIACLGRLRVAAEEEELTKKAPVKKEAPVKKAPAKKKIRNTKKVAPAA